MQGSSVWDYLNVNNHLFDTINSIFLIFLINSIRESSELTSILLLIFLQRYTILFQESVFSEFDDEGNISIELILIILTKDLILHERFLY